MSADRGALIAVDGVNGVALVSAARTELAAVARPRRGGISMWDASGAFQELAVARSEAGAPSARTLLLLYAADLAFRLRWQIRPAIAEGRVVVAAPYVATAVAFGRAAGLPGDWLKDLFAFAVRPDRVRAVAAGRARASAGRRGFIEFGCERLIACPHGLTQQQLVNRTREHLLAAAKRPSRPTARL